MGETLSHEWLDFKSRINRPELSLKPFLKILFYASLNGGNVSSEETIQPKIEDLTTKLGLQDSTLELSRILKVHPLINEVSSFLHYCKHLDGRVNTPLQDEFVNKVKKKSTNSSSSWNDDVRSANYKLASTLLQCVEYMTIVAAMDAFLTVSVEQNSFKSMDHTEFTRRLLIYISQRDRYS